MNELTRKDCDVLEALIDSLGVIGLLDAVTDVCYDKADHLQHNWQDGAAAKRWERLGIRLQTLKEDPAVRRFWP